MATVMVRPLLAVPFLLLSLLPAPPAQACSRAAATTRAFPAAGAGDISPRSSIYVAHDVETPLELTLEANGMAVPISAMEPLGDGWGGSWMKLTPELVPLTTYVLRTREKGAPVEITRFTTAAAPGASPGVAPRLETLRLIRVHHPSRLAGSCVTSEFEGSVELTYQPGVVPDTPPGEVVNVATLTPKAGGPSQRHVFPGLDPGGDSARMLPSPSFGIWKPQLDPDGELCLTLTHHGRNDRAFPALESQPLCAKVTTVEAPDPTATPDAGGCTVARGAPTGGLLLLAALALLGRSKRRE
jgi:hypothetical protein